MQHLTENLQNFITDRQGVVLLRVLSRTDADFAAVLKEYFCINLYLYEISSFFGKTPLSGCFFSACHLILAGWRIQRKSTKVYKTKIENKIEG